MLSETVELPKLQRLIGHREFVRATDSLELVHRRFSESKQDFLAVLDGRHLAGLCARRDIGFLLGARFGFALHARAPVSNHLTTQALRFTVEQPFTEVLNVISGRLDEHFYDDVLLTDARGEFLGLVYVRDLVRLQNALLSENLAEIEARNRQMENDLRMAREVQLALLPREFPQCRIANGNELRFAQLFEPAGSVSGDFFDVFPVGEHAIGIFVCDVMGHGVRSALVTAMVRTLMEELRPCAAQPAEFLTRLNHQLTRLLRHAGELIFATVSFIVVDVQAEQLTYGHAGHPPPLVWSARTGRAVQLPQLERIGGPALGLMEDHVYQSAQIAFATSDRLLVYTDGISEAQNVREEEYGVERLGRAVEKFASLELDAALAALRKSAFDFGGQRTFLDDVCLIACELQQSSEILQQSFKAKTAPG
jgi:serine phosphatase RsbU (regulator of sigma subunit)